MPDPGLFSSGLYPGMKPRKRRRISGFFTESAEKQFRICLLKVWILGLKKGFKKGFRVFNKYSCLAGPVGHRGA
jgi:hypothetical protein